MTKIDLLLTIYFEDKNEEGLSMLKKLLAAVDEARLTVFVGGEKQEIGAAGVTERISRPST